MLTVKTSNEAEKIIKEGFKNLEFKSEKVNINESLGRVLFSDICSNEFVPDFNRSTVDGFAVKASSTFGCSDAIPAILDYKGEVQMGEEPDVEIDDFSCCYVPTGGQIPTGANAMVMIEYAEDYGDGTRAMLKPSAPSQHIIFKGDDVKKGDVVLKKGTIIGTKDIGTLALLGIKDVQVVKRPKVAVISTGDELVDIDQKLKMSQMRDVNSYTLCNALKNIGCQPIQVGVVKDDMQTLTNAVEKACNECDVLLVSGGSSVGVKDATFKVFEKLGEVYMHGIAIKPGKPTIFGKIGNTPVFGLPGHPLAAFFIFNLFVAPALLECQNANKLMSKTTAVLDVAIPSNHGREECLPIRLESIDNWVHATPVFNKSGLISVLANSQGYLRVLRDCEGIKQGEKIEVTLF